MKKLILLITYILALGSCTKDLPLPPITSENIYIVNCFFSSDTNWIVNLTESLPLGSDKLLSPISSAQVTLLLNDTTVLEDLTESNGNYYSQAYMPQEGKLYGLKISHNGKTITTSDRVPYAVKVTKTDTSTTFFQGKNNFFKIELTFKDSLSVKNFYRLYVISKSVKYIKNNLGQVVDSVYIRKKINVLTTDPQILNSRQTVYAQNELLFEDETFDGKIVSLEFGSFDVKNSTSDAKIIELKVHLESLSENSYRYNTSFNEHVYYQNDPFSQTVDILSNVYGGKGIFGAYSSSVQIITF